MERKMRNGVKIIFAFFLTWFSLPVFSEPWLLDPLGAHWKMDRLGQEVVSRPKELKKSEPEKEPTDLRFRTHQEGILDISGTTLTPLRVNVKAGPVGVVGNLDIGVRHETNSRWLFRAENVAPDTNLWDSRGQALLIPGTVTCQVLYRASLNNYQQAGLTLSSDVPGLSLSMGVSTEKLRSDFFEGEDICPIGPIPAFTTKKDIETKCKKCLGEVLQTIKQDVNARLMNLFYRIETPMCSQDSDCYRENSDWLRGRCLLVQDPNGSYFSECRAKSSVGGACPGKGSRGLFEYGCDKGLACVKVQSATSFFDYNRYECRDPKNWKFKGPLKLSSTHASF